MHWPHRSSQQQHWGMESTPAVRSSTAATNLEDRPAGGDNTERQQDGEASQKSVAAAAAVAAAPVAATGDAATGAEATTGASGERR